MLTSDSLVEQAKQRGMPPTKMRGILREYLQVLILKELYRTRSGRKLFFTGGTYLRLVHNFKRFSEDLDFNTAQLTPGTFRDCLSQVSRELMRVGLICEIHFTHRGPIDQADLVFPEIEKKYGAISKFSKKEGIMIKVETHHPRWNIRVETQVISGFGELYPCLCTDRGSLFADKIDALVKKTRGRHLYDVLFLLSNQCPIDRQVLGTLGITENPLEVIRKRVQSFSKSGLKQQAESLRPFLFEEQEAQLLIEAHTVIPNLLDRYSGKAG